MEQQIQQLREGIYGFHTAAAKPDALYGRMANQYVMAAARLYETLLAKLAPLLTEQTIIVADGVLGYIPFDALLTTRPTRPFDFHTHAYFGRQHLVSHAYSATTWREMRQKKHTGRPAGNVLAMAPFSWGPDKAHDKATSADVGYMDTPGDALGALPYAAKECQHMDGPNDKILLADKASKDAFLREAPRYRNLHLSTHGVADDRIGDYAYLAFCKPGDITQFEKLYVRDIYGINLNADLVVLSACQSATGRLQQGEGIVSLTRAFTYAGAKQVVATLWSVNDDKTATIMQDLYLRLNATPANTAAALWETKKAYIGSHTPESAHPYFWAGIILFGA